MKKKQVGSFGGSEMPQGTAIPSVGLQQIDIRNILAHYREYLTKVGGIAQSTAQAYSSAIRSGSDTLQAHKLRKKSSELEDGQKRRTLNTALWYFEKFLATNGTPVPYCSYPPPTHRTDVGRPLQKDAKARTQEILKPRGQNYTILAAAVMNLGYNAQTQPLIQRDAIKLLLVLEEAAAQKHPAPLEVIWNWSLGCGTSAHRETCWRLIRANLQKGALQLPNDWQVPFIPGFDTMLKPARLLWGALQRGQGWVRGMETTLTWDQGGWWEDEWRWYAAPEEYVRKLDGEWGEDYPHAILVVPKKYILPYIEACGGKIEYVVGKVLPWSKKEMLSFADTARREWQAFLDAEERTRPLECYAPQPLPKGTRVHPALDGLTAMGFDDGGRVKASRLRQYWETQKHMGVPEAVINLWRVEYARKHREMDPLYSETRAMVHGALEDLSHLEELVLPPLNLPTYRPDRSLVITGENHVIEEEASELAEVVQKAFQKPSALTIPKKSAPTSPRPLPEVEGFEDPELLELQKLIAPD